MNTYLNLTLILLIFLTGCDIKKKSEDNSSNSYIHNHCQYKNGKREGLCIGTYSSDMIRDSTYYHNDLKHGKCIVFYPNGKLKYSTYYKNGLRNGIYLAYYDNGNLRRKSVYKNNKEIGIINEYDSLGNIKSISEWLLINGEVEMNFIKRFFPNGSLKYDSTFFADIQLNKDTFQLGEDIVITEKLYGNWHKRYKEHYSMKLIKGILDDDFSIVDSNSIKYSHTYTDDHLSLVVKAEKTGKNILRGFVAVDSSITPQTLSPSYSKKIYFERKYFVK